jgi:phosphate-selective porin
VELKSSSHRRGGALLALRLTAGALLLATALLPAQKAVAQETDPAPTIEAGYGDKGFWVGTSDGNYLLHAEFRFQFRYSYPFASNPVTFQEFSGPDQSSFAINRARFKVGGNAYRPWLKWYMEYELAAGALLDFRFMLEKLPALSLKVGQWKVHYNRERIISSGKQQMLERSIVTRPFTVDRQVGVSAFGRLRGNGAADFSYWAGVFTGMGRGALNNDDTHMMYSARVQWNMFGRLVGFSGSDLEHHEQPAALIAVAGNTNRSPFTRFSTAGGGELVGFAPGAPGQYRVYQWMAETAIKYRGLSWQQEFHWKQIDDRVNDQVTTLLGAYFEAGYFFHYAWDAIPKPLELALRYAIYDPRDGQASDLQRQYSLNLNWFFNGQRNKLSAQVSYLNFTDPVFGEEGGTSFQLQWDISI